MPGGTGSTCIQIRNELDSKGDLGNLVPTFKTTSIIIKSFLTLERRNSLSLSRQNQPAVQAFQEESSFFSRSRPVSITTFIVKLRSVILRLKAYKWKYMEILGPKESQPRILYIMSKWMQKRVQRKFRNWSCTLIQ